MDSENAILVEPNHVTFLGVLSACAHGVLVVGMRESGIEPSLEHYGCIIDLFCRANQIEEAYGFVMGTWSHPEATKIQKVLKEIADRVQATSHEPWIATVLRNVGDGEKRDTLWEHSERLAISFGVLMTQAPIVIRIVKNLRVYIDCHEVTKTTSKLYQREIIVRDRIRFHRFVNGLCSCKDFW